MMNVCADSHAIDAHMSATPIDRIACMNAKSSPVVTPCVGRCIHMRVHPIDV